MLIKVEHPMLEAHYITNIWVEYSDGTVDRAGLVPGMKPEYVFDLKGRTGNQQKEVQAT